MEDNELAFIAQRLISLRCAYDIQHDGESFATAVVIDLVSHDDDD